MQFALPNNIPAVIRHCLNRADAVGKSSIGDSSPIDYEEIYPDSATDLQSTVIDQAICICQGLALKSGRPPASNPSENTPAPQSLAAAHPHKPEKFDGTRSQFGQYITKLQMQFRSFPSAFATDEAKIMYAGSFLIGTAYTWFEPHVNQTSGAVDFKTFSDFIEAVRAAFNDPDSYATAERQLEALRQEGSCAA
ncbi:hypothetical protein K3495_g15097 [Podosphaera aphanis]|nr:hypothetical protein K3495_g15097 [Podosphaera aphanis]